MRSKFLPAVLLAAALLAFAAPLAAQTYDPVRTAVQQSIATSGGVRTQVEQALSLVRIQYDRLISLLAAYDSARAVPLPVDTMTVLRVDSVPYPVLQIDSVPYPVLQVDTMVDTVYVAGTAEQVALLGDAAAGLPELPRATVDVSAPALSGRVLSVAAGASLQAALDSARAGDVVEIEAGSTWRGPIVLRGDHGPGVVVVRSSRAGELPAGVRVTPADSLRMARIIGGYANASPLTVAGGTSGWRLVGLEVEIDPDTAAVPALVTSIVAQNYGSSDVVFDRVYVHANPLQGVQRCIVLNGGAAAVIDSHLSECHAVGTDAQAIEGWYGPGPYRIENNYLAGSGENVMFGGAAIGGGQLPSDIVIRGNWFHKPDAWRGGPWSIKNLLELKMARRLLIEDNLFDGSWANAQEGYTAIWKSENRDLPEHPEFYTSDITFRRNRIINSRYGIAVDGHASTARVSGPNHTRRVLIEDVEMALQDPYPKGVILLSGVKYATVQRVHMNGRVYLENGGHTGFRMTDNCTSRIMASGLREGSVTLDTNAPGHVFRRNTVVDLASSWVSYYPQGDGNQYPIPGACVGA